MRGNCRKPKDDSVLRHLFRRRAPNPRLDRVVETAFAKCQFLSTTCTLLLLAEMDSVAGSCYSLEKVAVQVIIERSTNAAAGGIIIYGGGITDERQIG